jgi:hypothetical protein
MFAVDIVKKVAKILNDDENIRCTQEELVMWFNLAQRDIVSMKPDTLTINCDISTVIGTKQSVKTFTVDAHTYTGVRLLDVIRNKGTGTRAIRPRQREVFDTTMPNWHADSAGTEIKFFMFDERDPTTFYNYPRLTAVGLVEVLVSIAPAEVADVAGLATTALSIPTVYESNMIDLMLSRALSKDSKIIGNMQRAQAHYAAAATSLGQKVQSDRYFAPTDGFSSEVSTSPASSGQ